MIQVAPLETFHGYILRTRWSYCRKEYEERDSDCLLVKVGHFLNPMLADCAFEIGNDTSPPTFPSSTVFGALFLAISAVVAQVIIAKVSHVVVAASVHRHG